MNTIKNKITVLFGSQTGNAEDIAGRIGRLVKRLHLNAKTSSLNDYPISEMVNEDKVIFVCSTTGCGEFPDNMKSFWKFLLRKDLPNTSLSHIQFCVFGLGDSSYEKYNVVAKKLNKRLLQLGAIEFLPLTLADDQHELGYDASLDPWLVHVKEHLVQAFDIKSENILPDDALLPPKFKVHFIQDAISEENFSSSNPSFKTSLPVATLKANNRVTSEDHFQAVHLLEFHIEDPKISYDAGDVAVVWPENPANKVEKFLNLLNVSLDTSFYLTPTDPGVSFPQLDPYPCTVRQCAKSFFDIMSIPKRSFFEYLHHFSRDELEKEKLVEFTTAAGQEELYSYCNRPRRSILEVLQDFPNTTPHVPFEYLFDMIPGIQPRNFSIASSIYYHPQEFHLLVAVVKYKTRLQKPRYGLCSNWLSHMSVGTCIPFSIKHGSITLSKNNPPLIMVGPGTGCAPFRNFIEERASKCINQNYLYFGCRYKARDFLCSKDWCSFSEKHLLTIIVAFSRDQEDKVYVQHKIKENSSLVWNLIHNEGAYIYIAGNAKNMPQDVKNAFIHVIEKEGGLDACASQKYIQDLINSRRYQTETWA